MKIATYKFEVAGDSYEELVSEADKEISLLTGFAEEDVDKYVNYEMSIQEDIEMETETAYTAEVVARIKYVRTDY